METKGDDKTEVLSEVRAQGFVVKKHGLMQLSLQILQKSLGARIMRLNGMHGRRTLYILVDRRSTHNS